MTSYAHVSLDDKRAAASSAMRLDDAAVVRTVANPGQGESRLPQSRRSAMVVRGRVEPPTFRFQE
jgi:hypothetical protein